MSVAQILFLACAGVIGGACNAIAGGGTFFTFPALLSVGVPPVVANATSAISIWPGHAAGIFAYREELRRHAGRLKLSAFIFAGGGLVGGLLLILTGDALFGALIPWLIFGATVMFAFGPQLRRLVHAKAAGRASIWLAVPLELIAAIYGGYFAAGLGILLIAILTLIGIEDLHEANAIKNALATIATTAAVVLFAATGTVAWAECGVVLCGAALGGYLGGRIARWVKPEALRAVVVIFGLVLTWHYAR